MNEIVIFMSFFVILHISSAVLGGILLLVMGAPFYMGAIIGVGVCFILSVLMLKTVGG